MTSLRRKIDACLIAFVSVVSVLAGGIGCHTSLGPAPSIEISHVPQADPGGPQKLDYIEGRVKNARPGQHVVIYAHSGIWWVQPFANQPDTKILPDNTWKNSTHLGTEYAALLVDAGYQPQSRLTALPPIGNGVAATATAQGKTSTAVVPRMLHFSGYDWVVRTAGSDRGGEPNYYDADNAWVDEKGFLHLRMTERDGKWTCAEVFLTRSLGYGTYRFIVADTARLNPSAVVGFFTWDDMRSVDFRNELDIELSKWGNTVFENAQYVVQPFYVPENVYRFTVPAGVMTHTFRWEPGRVAFRTLRGNSLAEGTKPVSEHVFTSGIPTPASETVHIDLYEFHHARNPSHLTSEVVIERFEYLP